MSLWIRAYCGNITYRYPTDDQIGADISKQIKDKIYVTQKKEG